MTTFNELSAQGRTNVLLIEQLAHQRYDSGYGWQVFVECYDRDELAEEFGGFPSAEQAVALAEDLAGIRDEQYSAATAEAF
jgi:hypothetical protein